jgi:hypothetical protein
MNKFAESTRDYRRYLCTDPVPSDFPDIQKELDEMNELKMDYEFQQQQSKTAASSSTSRPTSAKPTASSSGSNTTSGNTNNASSSSSRYSNTFNGFDNARKVKYSFVYAFETNFIRVFRVIRD